MDKVAGSSEGPSEKSVLPRDLFEKLVGWARKRGTGESDAEDLAQDAMIKGWETYKRDGGNPKTLPALIWYILRRQLLPQFFRGQSHQVNLELVRKQELLEELSPGDLRTYSRRDSESEVDRETLYNLMKKSLGAEKLESFFDDLLQARIDTDSDKHQFIKKAAEIANITEADARNRYRQIRKKIKATPSLLNYLKNT
jgi:DNA-directed RNA polymerase specialized sigma24 family protein